MKMYRNAVILLVIVGLLAGAFFLIKSRKDGKEADGTTDDTIKIFEFEQDNIAEITLENSDGKFVFVSEMVKKEPEEGSQEEPKEEKVWKASYPEDFKIDTNKVDNIAWNMARLNAAKVIEDNAENLSDYGLDKPVVITVKLKDGTVKALEIGEETPTKSGYYVKVKDSSKVYTISRYTGESLKLGRNDVRDRVLIGGTPEDMVALSMERGGQSVFSAQKKDKYDWALTSPIKADAGSAGISPILDGITKASVVNYIEENPADLEKYGLAKPQYAIGYEGSKGKGRLLLGYEKEKGSEIYAMFEGGSEVFTVSPANFNFIDKPLKEIVDVFAYIVNIDEVKTIKVEIDGQTVNCELQTGGEKEEDKFFVNGKDVTGLKDEKDSQLFRKLYQALIGVTFDELDIDAKPSGLSDITFTYELKKDPGVMKVEFIPKNERYYYVVRNGQYAGILVEKKAFDKPDGVRDSIKQIMSAINK